MSLVVNYLGFLDYTESFGSVLSKDFQKIKFWKNEIKKNKVLINVFFKYLLMIIL